MPASGRPVQLGPRVSPKLHKRLKLHCVHRSVTIEEFITQAIEEKLDRETATRSARSLVAEGEAAYRVARLPRRKRTGT